MLYFKLLTKIEKKLTGQYSDFIFYAHINTILLKKYLELEGNFLEIVEHIRETGLTVIVPTFVQF